ncbi:serine hydrolase [Streptomyces sp. NPDC004435]|uniref:serine hydrolase n=1 Tax=Streptomyces sp. NPDC004435 TaxID=3364701 RepID=UPI0036A2BA33
MGEAGFGEREGFGERGGIGGLGGLGGRGAERERGGGVPRGGALPRGTTLRWGTAAEAGLLGRELEGMVEDLRGFLGPSPVRPWCAGAVLLAGRGGTVALHRAVGWAARWAAYDEVNDTAVELAPELRVPMTPDTVFDLASLTKLFTSLLAVRQVERGTLELGERVASYLPEFGRAGKAGITVRQLLGHTSGLRAELPLYEAPDREGRLRMLWEEAPQDPPGTAYRYSDLNLIALHLLLERITGLALERLLHDEITAPLAMHRTRFVPPLSWRPGIAATEDARRPWARLDRGMVRGEVHDENGYAMGGVAGHAGVFSDARDLAVLARTLLNGGAYGSARVLSPASVDLLLTDVNQDFPGNAHGLGFELDQRWYMGALTGPRTAGHTGFTGTSLVLDPDSDAFLILLANAVHPVRTWRAGSAPRVAVANRLARAVPVRPPAGSGDTTWFSGMTAPDGVTLTLPATDPGTVRLTALLWWDTAPDADRLTLEATTGTTTRWHPVPFETTPTDRSAEAHAHPDGTADGWSGRRWHRLTAALTAAPGTRLRFRYVTSSPAVGRGVYVTGLRLLDRSGTPLFDDSRPADEARVEAAGWHRSAD